MVHSIGCLLLPPAFVHITYGSVFDYFIPRFIDATFSTSLHIISYRTSISLRDRIPSLRFMIHDVISNQTEEINICKTESKCCKQSGPNKNRYITIAIKYGH